MADLIQIRRDSGSNWSSVNPTLALGEIGIITDNNTAGNTGSVSLKVGNGQSTWNQLPEQAFVKPDDIQNLSASIAAVQTGSAGDIQEVSASINTRINSVSSSLSTSIANVSTSLGNVDAKFTAATSSLSASIASVDTRLTTVSGSISASMSSMSSSINTRINEVSESITVAIEETIPVISQSISASAAELNDRIDGVEQDIQDNYARQDGYYSTLTAGAAENLVGQTVDSEAYLIRPTGGKDNEVANGVASVLGMEGNSCVWNQNIPLLSSSWTTSTVSSIVNNRLIFQRGENTVYSNQVWCQLPETYEILSTHTYYISAGVIIDGNTANVPFGVAFGGEDSASGKIFSSTTLTSGYVSGISKPNADNTTSRVYVSFLNVDASRIASGTQISAYDVIIIDLTLLGIDNLTTVAQVEAWLAEHVGTKPYYAYNAGTILSAQTLGIKTYGQNLLNPTTRQAKLIPYEWEDNSNVYTIKNVPSGATATFTPDSTGVAESVTITNNTFDITSYGSGILELSAATAETYVCMKWDESKDNDIVPFEEYIQDFDVRKVYGKVSGAGDYVQCYPQGLRSAGVVHDTLTASEAVVRIGSMDLGTLNWEYSQNDKYFQVDRRNASSGVPSNMKLTGADYIINAITSNYIAITYSVMSSGGVDSNNLTFASTSPYFVVKNLSYTDATTFRTAMSGVMLNYELATPITYTDLVYRDGGIDRPLSDVLFNIDVDNWSIEEQLLTPYEDGNPTAVPAKISTQYGMDAVEEIDTIKHTYVSAYTEQNFSDSQKAQARRNIGAVETDGTYPNMSVGLAKNLAGENAVEAEYIYRQSGGTIGTDTGIANVTAVKGKSLVWNQLIVDSLSPYNDNIITITKNSTSDYTCTTTSTGAVSGLSQGVRLNTNIPSVQGHKVYVRIESSLSDIILYGNKIGNVHTYGNQSFIITINSTVTYDGFVIYPQATFEGSYTLKNVMLIDLTLMFGAGNEPSTVEEFEALYPLDYYDYNAGTLINNNASAIETTGFNQWNEEWENCIWNESQGGVKVLNNNSIGCKDYIKVFPGTSYYFEVSKQCNCYILQYRKDKTMISYTLLYQSGSFTTNTNCQYVTFYSYNSYGTTYNHDICINISDPAKNGTYESYEKHTFYFDKVLTSSGSLATITGKLNGEGDSVTVFPDGLKSVGTVYDEIKGNVAIKRIGSVDLGTLTWTLQTSDVFLASIPEIVSNYYTPNLLCPKYTTNPILYTSLGDKEITNRAGYKYVYIRDSAYTDAATFKTAVSGVMLYYELATPETYTLDQTVTGGYQVNALGTEQRLPEDTSSVVNAPVRYSVIYPIDAVGTIIKLPINYISEGSLTNFTTELASKLGTFLSASINVSASYDTTSQQYDYSITITPNA